MKRILCIIAALVILMTSPCHAFVKFADIDSDRAEEAISFFNDLGYIDGFVDGSFKPEVGINRGDFSILIAKLNNCDESGYSSAENPFKDISLDELAKYVNFLYERNIIRGVSEDEFAPNNGIAPIEAVAIVLRNLGYNEFAEAQGGYPMGYLKTATKLDLLKNIDMSAEFLTRGDACALLYNMIRANVLELYSMEDDNETYATGGTFMEEVMDVTELTGFVTATAYGCVYDNINVDDGKISIDYNTYSCSMPNSDDLLGYNVRYYVKNLSDSPVVISAYPHDNTTIELEYHEISDKTDTHTVYYYDDGDRERSVSLADSAYFVYNGRGTADLKTVKPEYGRLRLIDQDSDEIYDTAIIEDYENYRVDGVSASTLNILTTDNTIIETDDDSVSIVKDGGSITADKIAKDNIISVAVSRDGVKTNIYVSDNTISGVIERINPEDNSAVIDGTEYRVPGNEVYSEIIPGNRGTFYLDFLGNIADYDEEEDDKCGYLRKVLYSDDDMENEYALKIKIIDLNGQEVVLNCREKLNIVSDGINSLVSKPEIAYNMLIECENKFLIKYKTNESGVVTEIEKPRMKSLADWGMDNFTCNFDTDQFALETGNPKTCRFMNSYAILYPNADLRNKYGVRTDENTKFVILDEANGQYKVGNSSKVSATTTYDGMKIFDVNEFGIAKYIVFYQSVQNTTFSANADYFITVTGSGKMVNEDDEIVQYVEGYALKQAEKVRLYVKEENSKCYSMSSYDGLMYKKGLTDDYVCDVSDIGPGDVLQFRTGDDPNEMVAFRRLNKCGNTIEYRYGYETSDEVAQVQDLSLNFLYSPLTAYGTVTKTGNNYIVMENSEFFLPYTISTLNSTNRVVIVKNGGRSVELGNLSDVYCGAKIHICYNGLIRWLQLTIYEE